LKKARRLWVAACLLALVPGFARATQAKQPLKVTNFGDMDPVVFDHTTHAESFSCETCHHAKRSGGSHRCGSCHEGEASAVAMTFEDAAHKEGVGKCWGCHFKNGAQKKLECEQCHGAAKK